MSERKYYLFCEDNCKFEGMTKEQILTAIQQAVEEGEIHDVDTGFITKILEQNGNAAVKVWVGTEAQFNAITNKAEDTIYIYTTTFEEDITNEVNKIKDGTTVVPNATKVNNLQITRDANGVLKIGDTIIPQKNLLWSGETKLTYNQFINKQLTGSSANRTLELVICKKLIFNSNEYMLPDVLKVRVSSKNDINLTEYSELSALNHSAVETWITIFSKDITAVILSNNNVPYLYIKNKTQDNNLSIYLLAIYEVIE